MNTPTRAGRRRARLIAIAAAVPFIAASALGAATAASAAPPATPPGQNKVTFCHATGSESNPFVVITTAMVAWEKAHDVHQNDEDVLGVPCGYGY